MVGCGMGGKTDRKRKLQPEFLPPDDLRCVRNDGRKWRCSGWKLQDKSHCEYHHLEELARKSKKSTGFSANKAEISGLSFRKGKGKGKQRGDDEVGFTSEEEVIPERKMRGGSVNSEKNKGEIELAKRTKKKDKQVESGDSVKSAKRGSGFLSIRKIESEEEEEVRSGDNESYGDRGRVGKSGGEELVKRKMGFVVKSAKKSGGMKKKTEMKGLESNEEDDRVDLATMPEVKGKRTAKVVERATMEQNEDDDDNENDDDRNHGEDDMEDKESGRTMMRRNEDSKEEMNELRVDKDVGEYEEGKEARKCEAEGKSEINEDKDGLMEENNAGSVDLIKQGARRKSVMKGKYKKQEMEGELQEKEGGFPSKGKMKSEGREIKEEEGDHEDGSWQPRERKRARKNATPRSSLRERKDKGESIQVKNLGLISKVMMDESGCADEAMDSDYGPWKRVCRSAKNSLGNSNGKKRLSSDAKEDNCHMCHQCQKSDRIVVRCRKGCRKRYCGPCIQNWWFLPSFHFMLDP